MSGAAGQAADPVEQRIEAALAPGRFVSDRACFSFVGDLEAVEREIADLVEVAPGRAVALYEAFLASCYEKADEVDDSTGSFGMFVTSLCCGWVKARQAAGAAADETATRLLEWMDDDPFGFCYRLERDVAKVLDEAGLAALASQVRARLDKVSAAEPKTDSDESPERDHARRRLAEVLRTLYRQQADLEAYLGLAQQTGLTAADCHAAAVMLAARGAPGLALSWVERGIELDSTARTAPSAAMSWPSSSLACSKSLAVTARRWSCLGQVPPAPQQVLLRRPDATGAQPRTRALA